MNLMLLCQSQKFSCLLFIPFFSYHSCCFSILTEEDGWESKFEEYIGTTSIQKLKDFYITITCCNMQRCSVKKRILNIVSRKTEHRSFQRCQLINTTTYKYLQNYPLFNSMISSSALKINSLSILSSPYSFSIMAYRTSLFLLRR